MKLFLIKIRKNFQQNKVKIVMHVINLLDKINLKKLKPWYILNQTNKKQIIKRKR